MRPTQPTDRAGPRRDPLHDDRPELVEPQALHTAVHELANWLRQQHLARPGDVDDAGGQVHVVADEIGAATPGIPMHAARTHRGRPSRLLLEPFGERQA